MKTVFARSLPLLLVLAVMPALFADVKTREKSTMKLEGFIAKMLRTRRRDDVDDVVEGLADGHHDRQATARSSISPKRRSTWSTSAARNTRS